MEFDEIKQNKGHYAVQLMSFKVTDVGTNRKTVCDFLLVNNTNCHYFHYYYYYYMIYIAQISRIESEALASLGGEHD